MSDALVTFIDPHVPALGSTVGSWLLLERIDSGSYGVVVDFGSGWFPGARPLTDTPAPPGTTPYRAPELLRFMWRFRRNTEARWQACPSDDMYALGVTAYRLVTGTSLPSVTEDAEPRKLLRPRELATVTLELEIILLRLLSEDRVSRGSATEIATAMERSARQAGPEADRPILPTSAVAPTEQGAPRFSLSSSRSRSTRPSTVPKRRAIRITLPAWLSSAITAVVSGLIVAVAAELRRPYPPEPEPWIASPEEWHVPPIETPDAGVGEETLLSVEDFPRGSLHVVFAAPLPKKPASGQRKPPCHPTGEIAALGACWAVLSHKPPCNGFGYEHEDRCVIASFDSPRQPTSEQP
ncbi:hypothetical protein [Hyalangium sp.]|uniref:hypothetical protein n=1 Tax=Hyalangium sp. TaxID=2028555 RepID=UPI002D5A27C8|nr:hypothetical protein [Hyalangium sp.]HYH98737.1 hypothetical protein [Hyalangium sp.]